MIEKIRIVDVIKTDNIFAATNVFQKTVIAEVQEFHKTTTNIFYLCKDHLVEFKKSAKWKKYGEKHLKTNQDKFNQMILDGEIMITSNQTVEEEIEDLRIRIQDLKESKKDGSTHIAQGFFKKGGTSITLAGNINLHNEINKVLEELK